MATSRADQQLPSTMRDALVWLQEQMTQVRDRVARLQQDTDESMSRLAALHERIDELGAGLAGADREGRGIATIRGEVGELRELASQLQQRLASADLRQQKTERLHALDSERERQARSELAKRIDDLSQPALAIEARMNVLEEAQNHQREISATLRQEADGLRSATTDLQGGQSSLSETASRLEARLSALEGRADESARVADRIAERAQLAAERGRRLEKQLDTIVAERLSALDELSEQIGVLRAERARFESRLQATEQRLDRDDELVTEQESRSTQLLGRLKAVDERLAQLQAELDGLNETVVSQLLRFGQTLERQRRRQIGDLEREIREFKQHATRLSEE